MKERFTRLYEYNVWANDLFCDMLKSTPYKEEQINKFLSHIGNAQMIWLSRIKEMEEEIPAVWDVYSPTEAIELVKKSSQLWLEFIYSHEEYSEVVQYKNSKGNEFESKVSDILTHVANHSTHHRGQIALLLRQENIEPPASDFIFYVRT